MKKRKRRSDRNQAIYQITNIVTNETYVGLTVVSYNGNAVRTINRRFQKHVQRAMTENKTWTLSESIRKYGSENFKTELVIVVRGKELAHQIETDIINEFKPALNTFKRN